MNESLRDRIVRHLEPLPDERGYQVLDFIEFLESKYATSVSSSPSLFQRFTEGVEDTLRAGRVSTTAIAETMGLLNRAVGVLNGVAAAGKSVATDIVTTGKDVASGIAAAASKAAEAATSSPTPPAAPDKPVAPPSSSTPPAAGGPPPSPDPTPPPTTE
jgi:hypothetical protein